MLSGGDGTRRIPDPGFAGDDGAGDGQQRRTGVPELGGGPQERRQLHRGARQGRSGEAEEGGGDVAAEALRRQEAACDRDADAFSRPPTEEEFQAYVREHFWDERKGIGGWDCEEVFCYVRRNAVYA